MDGKMGCILLFPQKARLMRGVEKFLPRIRRRDCITQTVDNIYRARADMCNIIQGIDFIQLNTCMQLCDKLRQWIDDWIRYEKIKLVIQGSKRTIYKQSFYLWELRSCTDQCCCSHGAAPCADMIHIRLCQHI